MSQLAGITVSHGIRNITNPAQQSQTVMQAMGRGLLEGATNLGIGFAGEQAGLDPLAQALSSRAIVGFLDGAFNPHKTVGASIFDAFKKSTFDLATLGGDKANDPYSRAVYLAKINDFSNIIRERGLTTALETYATSIFQRQAVEDIYRLGGFADLLLGNVSFTKLNGLDVKKITINSDTALFLDPITEDIRGRQLSRDYIEAGVYGISPDGQFKLLRGSVSTRVGGDLWVNLKIEDGLPNGYSFTPVADDPSQSRLVVTPEAFNADGSLRSAVIENKVTGVKLVLKDGWLVSLTAPTVAGELASTELLSQVSVARLSPEEMGTMVEVVLSNGINNLGQIPAYLESWRQEYERAGGDPNKVMFDPVYENGKTPIFSTPRDLSLWLMDTAGLDPVTNDWIAAADARFIGDGGLPTGTDRLVLAYSGSGNPAIKALHRKDYGVSTYLGVGTVEPSKSFTGTSVTRAIRIVGEDDWVAGLFFGNRPFTGVENQYRIVLQDISHTDYGYDPNNTSSANPLALKAAQFIGLVERHYNDDTWLGQNLEKYRQTDGRYSVDLEQFARDHGF